MAVLFYLAHWGLAFRVFHVHAGVFWNAVGYSRYLSLSPLVYCTLPVDRYYY